MSSNNSHVPPSRKNTSMTGLRRIVSFNNQAAFALPHGTTEDKEVDEALASTKQLAIIMVGLPACGKSHIASCLKRYLNWLGFPTKVYNVGIYRRRLMDGKQDASFFDPDNTAGVRKRTELAMQCLDDMIAWFEKGGGLCGIYDATNSTRARRAFVKAHLAKAGVRVLFLESICTDARIVDRNIMDTKLRSPDYSGMDPEKASSDFRSRIKKYSAANETLSEDEQLSYVKVINVGKQIVLNNIRGYLQGKIVSFLLNTHISQRSIFLTRAGESENLASGKLGGDPSLTPNGKRYSHALAEFMRNESEKGHCLKVWTSQLKRTRETVAPMGLLSVCWRALNEIDAGICEGLTYGEIESSHPDVARERKNDKLRYRYPQGESYVDLIHRLEPVILELERTRAPMLVVAHNAVIRCMLAYFTGKSQEECPFIDIPLNTVFKLTTRAYGVEVERFKILEDGV